MHKHLAYKGLWALAVAAGHTHVLLKVLMVLRRSVDRCPKPQVPALNHLPSVRSRTSTRAGCAGPTLQPPECCDAMSCGSLYQASPCASARSTLPLVRYLSSPLVPRSQPLPKGTCPRALAAAGRERTGRVAPFPRDSTRRSRRLRSSHATLSQMGLLLFLLLAPSWGADPAMERAQEYVRRLRIASPPPDVLGGATLGKPPPAGFICTAVDCSKHMTVAGEDGNVTLTLCGSVAQQITFTVTYVDIRRVEGQALGIQPSADPASSGAKAADRIFSALEQAFWMCGELSPTSTFHGAIAAQSECYASDGRHRTVGISLITDPVLGPFTLTQIVASTTTACTSGL